VDIAGEATLQDALFTADFPRQAKLLTCAACKIRFHSLCIILNNCLEIFT